MAFAQFALRCDTEWTFVAIVICHEFQIGARKRNDRFYSRTPSALSTFIPTKYTSGARTNSTQHNTPATLHIMHLAINLVQGRSILILLYSSVCSISFPFWVNPPESQFWERSIRKTKRTEKHRE